MKYLLLIGLMINLIGCGDSLNKIETSLFPDGSYKLQKVQITENDKVTTEIRNQLKIYSNERYMFAFMHPSIGVDVGAGIAKWKDGIMTETPLFNHNGSVSGFEFDLSITQTETGFTQSLTGLVSEDGSILDMIEDWITISSQNSPYDGLWQLETTDLDPNIVSQIKMIGGSQFIELTRSKSGSDIQKQFNFGEFYNVSGTGIELIGVVGEKITNSSHKNNIGEIKTRTYELNEDNLIVTSSSVPGETVIHKYKRI
ncbi:MAG: hypothetical protein VX503_05120 [Pseudomonadota bacterium]|nr:hypothetical protein [Pseudomonadota bacterium]